MVVISGALCTVQDFVLMASCQKQNSKVIHVAQDGKVSLTVTPIQNITITGHMNISNISNIPGEHGFKLTLYEKETNMLLCFNKKWKLVGMKHIKNQTVEDGCYFTESFTNSVGYRYHSIKNRSQLIGFTARGKAIGPHANLANACYYFSKLKDEEYYNNINNNINNKNKNINKPHMTSTKAIYNNRNNNNNGTSNSRNRNNLNNGHHNSNTNNYNNRNNTNGIIHLRRHHHGDQKIIARRRNHRRLRQQHQHHETTSSSIKNADNISIKSSKLIRNDDSMLSEVGIGGARRKMKKNRNLKQIQQQQQKQSVLHPRVPEHRRQILNDEQNKEQQQQHQNHHHSDHHQKHDHQPDPKFQAHLEAQNLGGSSYINIGSSSASSFQNVQDEYSNDDASAINILPNSLDSSTEYVFNSNNKKYLISNNDKKLTNLNTLSSNIMINENMLDSQTRKYYKKSTPALIPATFRTSSSSIVDDQINNNNNYNNNNKLLSTRTNLIKMKDNYKKIERNSSRLRKKLQIK